MRFLKYICAASILMASLCSFWSCNDDDSSKLSKAVLASANTLNFDGVGAGDQIITVYADEEWVSEAPAWITITPSSGNRETDVTISVTDNLRDGALDNPRKVSIVFKGRTLESRAEVLVLQVGDKYRDVKDYTLGQIAALENESVVSVPGSTVVAVTTGGFVVSNDQMTDNMYVLNVSDTEVNVGDKLRVMGVKYVDTQSLAYIESDLLEDVVTGGTVTYPAPLDITADIDKQKERKTRDFVLVKGVLKGNIITIEAEVKNSVNVVEAPASLGLAALNGHRVTIKGYFAGVAEPVVRIMGTEIEDNGVAKTIYFSEDFEWLEPWSVAGAAGKTVETDDLAATAPALTSLSVIVEGVSVTAYEAFEKRGYELIYDKNDNKRIYLQRNYLKFGKTGNHAGIILPSITGIPEGTDVKLSFDWCGMRQGSGKIDPVNLIVIIENGDNKRQFDIPELGWEDNHKLEWVGAEVDLKGVLIDKDTKITITQTQWEVTTANRWFLDNIEIFTPD